MVFLGFYVLCLVETKVFVAYGFEVLILLQHAVLRVKIGLFKAIFGECIGFSCSGLI